MTYRVLKKRKAQRDLTEYCAYIGEDNPRAGGRFLNSARNTLTTLASMPKMGALRYFENPKLVDIRCWPIKGFEHYLIFYRPIKNGIEVIRILHASQDIRNILNEQGD